MISSLMWGGDPADTAAATALRSAGSTTIPSPNIPKTDLSTGETGEMAWTNSTALDGMP